MKKNAMPAGRQGFTIVELIIYMGLVSVFLTMMGQVFFSILDLQLESKASSDVQQDGQYILARMGYDVRRATAVVTPGTAGQAGSILTLTIGGAAYTYSVNGGDIQLTTGGVTQNLTSFGAKIDNFWVTRLQNPGGKPSLNISFTLTSRDVNLQQRSEVKSYQQSLTLR